MLRLARIVEGQARKEDPTMTSTPRQTEGMNISLIE
jgi:hypothetical protein